MPPIWVGALFVNWPIIYSETQLFLGSSPRPRPWVPETTWEWPAIPMGGFVCQSPNEWAGSSNAGHLQGRVHEWMVYCVNWDTPLPVAITLSYLLSVHPGQAANTWHEGTPNELKKLHCDIHAYFELVLGLNYHNLCLTTSCGSWSALVLWYENSCMVPWLYTSYWLFAIIRAYIFHVCFNAALLVYIYYRHTHGM